MPYSITTKDGITIQNIPDDVAPDSQSLKDRVAAIRAGGGQGALAPPGFGERFVGGLKESGAGMAQLASRAIPAVGALGGNQPGQPTMQQRQDAAAQEAINRAEAMSQQVDGIDFARLLGNATATAPLAAIGGAPATLGRAALAGAVQGGAQGAIAPVALAEGESYGEKKAGQIVGGTALGAVATPIGLAGLKLIGNAALRGYQSLARTVGGAPDPAQLEASIAAAVQREGVDWAALDDAVKQSIRDEVKSAGAGATELDAQVLANRATLRQAGVSRPTLAQETQSPTQFGREQFLAASPEGEALATQKNQQFEELNTALRNIAARSSPALDREAAGAAAMAPVVKRAQQIKGRVDRLYDIARNAAGRDQPIPAGDLANRVLPELERKAILTALPQDLATVMRAVQQPDAPPITISRAEEILKAANYYYGKANASNDGAAKEAINIFKRELNKSLDDAVEASGDPRALTALRSANKAAAERFKELDSVPALKAVSDGEIEPDFFMQKFVNGPRVDNNQLRTLKAFYQKRDPAAWSQVRGQVIDDLYQKASSGSERQFNLATYNRELDKVLSTGRAKILFEPDELAQLKTMGKAEKLIQGPQGKPPPTGLTGAAFAAERLARIVRSLGTFKLGLVAEPIANFVQSQPARAATRAAQQGAAVASRPAVQIPQALTDRLQRASAAGIGASAAIPFTQGGN